MFGAKRNQNKNKKSSIHNAKGRGGLKNTTSETQGIPDLLPEETELDDNSLQQLYLIRNLD